MTRILWKSTEILLQIVVVNFACFRKIKASEFQAGRFGMTGLFTITAILDLIQSFSALESCRFLLGI